MSSHDLHWIDEQTQELLNLLTDSIGTAKIVLLVNYRPESLVLDAASSHRGLSPPSHGSCWALGA